MTDYKMYTSYKTKPTINLTMINNIAQDVVVLALITIFFTQVMVWVMAKKIGKREFKKQIESLESRGYFMIEIIPSANFAIYANSDNTRHIEVGKRPTQ